MTERPRRRVGRPRIAPEADGALRLADAGDITEARELGKRLSTDWARRSEHFLPPQKGHSGRKGSE